VGEDARVIPSRANFLFVAAALFPALACEKDADKTSALPAAASTPPQATTTPPAPEPPKAPEIIVDSANVSVGTDRVPAGEQGLADKVAVFVTGRPAIAGQPVDFVAMRNAKPSQVAAVASALRRARASIVSVKTEGRDGTTQKIALSSSTSGPDCTTVAWIAKDGAIDVWPVSGGTAKRIIKGMAGPDMTLGTEAVEKHAASCTAQELIVGAEDRFPWGLVFDLATQSLQSSGGHLGSVILVTNATPGRKTTLDAP
jgi:hypothetical protein